MRHFLFSPLGILISLTVLVLALIYGAGAFGYHIDKSLRFVQTASVAIATTEKDIRVFVDDKEKEIEVEKSGELVVHRVSPGIHSFLITRDSFRPWVKVMTIEQGATGVTVRPFFVPRTPDLKPLEDTQTIALIQREEAKQSKPTKQFPLISDDGTVSLFVSGNDVIANWIGEGETPVYFCNDEICDTTHVVYSGSEAISSVDFFRGRNDVVVIAEGNILLVREIDRRIPINSFELYRGVSVSFTPADDALYIKDGDFYFTLSLN